MERKHLVRIGVVGVLCIAIALGIVLRDQLQVSKLTSWIQGFGTWSMAVFIGVYVIATVLVFPGSILTITGGLLFGPWWGALCNLTGATLGATMSFLISRYISSGWVRRKTGSRLDTIVRGIEEEGWRFVAFLRLVPVFPFDLTNYALGLTKASGEPAVLIDSDLNLPGKLGEIVARTPAGFGEGEIDGES